MSIIKLQEDMMKRTALSFSLLILLLLVSSCENLDISKFSDEDLERISDKAIVCNAPYIRFATSCCLDQNDNKICDVDEGLIARDDPNGFDEGISVSKDDSKCGTKKQLICHKELNNKNQELCVDKSSVQAHIGHGDYVGECSTNNKCVESFDDYLSMVVKNEDVAHNLDTPIPGGAPPDLIENEYVKTGETFTSRIYFKIMWDTELKQYQDCLKQSSDKDQCKSRYAHEIKNPCLCDEINEPDTRDFCYRSLVSFTSDPSLCEKIISQKEKDTCYSILGSKAEFTDYCSNIQDETIKTSCFDSSYRFNALLKGDIIYCERIASTEIKDECIYSLLINSTTIDGCYCNKIRGNYKYDCFLTIAKKRKESDFCSLSGGWMANCYKSFSQSIPRDVSILQKKVCNPNFIDEKHSFCNLEGGPCSEVQVTEYTNVEAISIGLSGFREKISLSMGGCTEYIPQVVRQDTYYVQCPYKRGTDFENTFSITYPSGSTKSGKLYLIDDDINYASTSGYPALRVS
ncbi:hypothetical protein J4212_06280 [Candidatus Woesearchaeota archaeon]|nr:hypothetical protein [Candidatus Woesearchaeota archaeon]